MRRSGLFITVITMFLPLAAAWPCHAQIGLVWSGDVTAEENYQNSEYSLGGIVQIKTEISDDEKQIGAVLLRGQTADNAGGPAGQDHLSCYLAYIDLTPSAHLLIRTGRQKIAWGSGFSWNPTNYIGSGKNRSEFMQDNPGVDAVDLEYTQTKFAAVAALKPESNPDESGKAVKLSWQIGGGDLAVSAFQQSATKAWGVDFSTVAGDYTVYLETAWKAGDRDYFHIHGGSESERPEDRYYLHGIIGASGFVATDLSVILEYYYNQAGWTSRETADYYAYWEAQSVATQARLNQKTAALMADLSQNYVYLMLKKDHFLLDELSFSASILKNTDDGSYLLTPMFQYNFTPNTYCALNMNFTNGPAHSEFGSATALNNFINAKVVFMF
jgi:hypothetical protein